MSFDRINRLGLVVSRWPADQPAVIATAKEPVAAGRTAEGPDPAIVSLKRRNGLRLDLKPVNFVIFRPEEDISLLRIEPAGDERPIVLILQHHMRLRRINLRRAHWRQI